MEADGGMVGAMAARAEPEGVGAFLRARRKALGLTHADVANVVKLPPRRIEALEDERWSELPDGPFLRGFLRNVARALDLDATTLMDRVDDSLMRSRNPESILVPPSATPVTLPRRSGPIDDRHGGRKLVFGAFAFALVAALIAWSGTDSFERLVGRTGATPRDGVAVKVPPAPAAAIADEATVPHAAPASVSASVGAPAAAPDATSVAAATAATTSAAQPSGDVALAFHFNEESWVEVKAADGRVLLQRLNAAGSDQVVDGEPPYSLIVGNAKGVALRFHGQPVDLGPYTHDQVARLTLS